MVLEILRKISAIVCCFKNLTTQIFVSSMSHYYQNEIPVELNNYTCIKEAYVTGYDKTWLRYTRIN